MNAESHHHGWAFNARTLRAPCSGVQRYAGELSRRLRDPARIDFAPTDTAQGLHGHLWEQFVLPARVSDRLLFSPGNTGPLACRFQVVTIHDASTFDYPEAFTGMFGRWYRWLLPRLARRVAAVVTVSQFSRERLVYHCGIEPDRIHVIPNGITTPVRIASPVALARVRRNLQLPSKFFLFVGTQDPRKNLDRLVKAFARALPRLGDYHLVIAGGANAQLFRGKSDRSVTHGRVHRIGRVSEFELDALYRMADAFVFPSLYEGFGLPPLEAMCRRCPVLCSNTSSLPEVAGPGVEQGGAAWYFNPSDEEGMAAALISFAKASPRLRETMVAAGLARAANYSWERCASQTASLLAEVAGHAGVNPIAFQISDPDGAPRAPVT